MGTGTGKQVQEVLRTNRDDEEVQLNRVKEEQASQKEFFGLDQGPAHSRRNDSYLQTCEKTKKNLQKTRENLEVFVIPKRSKPPKGTVSGHDKWNTTRHNFTSCSEITNFPSSSEPNDFQRYFSLGQPSDMSMVDNEMSGEARQNLYQFIIPRCPHLPKDTEPGIINPPHPSISMYDKSSCSEALLTSS